MQWGEMTNIPLGQLIRLKWSLIANLFGTLQSTLDVDVAGFVRENPKTPSPGGTGGMSL